MESHDALANLLSPILDERLENILKGTDLSTLSRIPTQRLTRTALVHVASIESVSGSIFDKHYKNLYESSFHGGERERSDLIVSRLVDGFANVRKGLAPYHVIGLRDRFGNALGAAQFSILFLPHLQKAMAIPYLQYIYIRPSHRRQDLSELLHTLVLGMTIAEARRHWNGSREVDVPYTLCETEPPVHGSDKALQAKAKERAETHRKSGSIALMLRDPKKVTEIVSAHAQPGLEAQDSPLTLIWILRANPANGAIQSQDQRIAISLLEAYYNSLRDEGFPEQNILLAENMVHARRLRGFGEFCLLDIGDVTREMYVGIDQ